MLKLGWNPSFLHDIYSVPQFFFEGNMAVTTLFVHDELAARSQQTGNQC
jgi:hypothetical protein